MGMFDTLFCEVALPLSDRLRGLDCNWSKVDFQTKSLDNSLSNYTISKDGDLLLEIIENEYIRYTDEELKTLKIKPWTPFKEVKLIKKEIVKINHHGEVNFYTSLDYTAQEELWVDFRAYFIYGKLDKIELVNENTTISQKAASENWIKEQEKINSKPWSRFKRSVRRFGWHSFWRKTANITYKIGDFFHKVHWFIIQNML